MRGDFAIYSECASVPSRQNTSRKIKASKYKVGSYFNHNMGYPNSQCYKAFLEFSKVVPETQG